MRMKLSLVLCVSLALCLLGMLYYALEVYNPGVQVIMMRTMEMAVGDDWQVSISIGLPNFEHVIVKDDTAVGLNVPPLIAESMAAEWLGNTGLSHPQRWVTEKLAILNENIQQPPAGTESMACVQPSFLDRLWKALEQVDRTLLLHRTCGILFLLFTACIILHLLRNVWRPQGQVSNRDWCQRKRCLRVKKGGVRFKARKAHKEEGKHSVVKKASASLEKFRKSNSSSRESQVQHNSLSRPETLAIPMDSQVCQNQGNRLSSLSSVGLDCKSTDSDYDFLSQMEANYIQLLRQLRKAKRLHLEDRRRHYKKMTCQ